MCLWVGSTHHNTQVLSPREFNASVDVGVWVHLVTPIYLWVCQCCQINREGITISISMRGCRGYRGYRPQKWISDRCWGDKMNKAKKIIFLLKSWAQLTIIRRIKQVSGNHPRQLRNGTRLSDLIAFHESKASARVCSLNHPRCWA